MTRESGYIFYNQPKSQNCVRARNEVHRAVNHYDFFVRGTQEHIDTGSQKILSGVSKSFKVERDLTNINTVINVLSPLLVPLGFLPYVGPAFKLLKKAVDLANRAIKFARDAFKRFNGLLRRFRVEERVTWIQEKNEKVGATMNKVVYMTEKYVVGAILLADGVCSTSYSRKGCDIMYNVLEPVNRVLDNIKRIVQIIADAVRNIGHYFLLIINLVLNAAWKIVTDFFNGIKRLLQPFIDILYRRICITLPIPYIWWKRVCITLWLPCGVHFCRGCTRIWCGFSCGGCGWRGCRCWNNYCNICIVSID